MADPYISREPDYRDLDLDFFKSPGTGDIVKKVGVEAIKRSVRNLVFTNFYEKPFRPFIGSEVRNYLFDNLDELTSIFLKDAITDVLQNYEPRIEVKDISVKTDLDNNGFNVRLEYIIRNRETPVVSTLFLERIR